MPLPFSKNKGTRSSFFSKKATPAPTTLPQATPDPITVIKPAPAVTQEATNEAATDQVDDKLNPKPTPIRDQLQIPTAPPKGSEQQGQSETRTKHTDISAYQRFWKGEDVYKMRPVRHSKTNFYAPSAIPLFKILESAERRVNMSSYIQKHKPEYLPYAVKVYYAIVFYRQILRAKKAAGKLDGNEITLMSRLDKEMPENSVPIPECLYPYFNTIIATEIADIKYDWVVPNYCTENVERPHATNSFAEFAQRNGGIYLQPNVPAMLGLLSQFAHEEQTTYNAHMRNNRYEPVAFHATNANVVFEQSFNNNNHTNHAFKSIFASCGFNSPFSFGNDNVNYARESIADSDFYDLVDYGVTADRGLINRRVYSDITTFLFLQKGKRIGWLRYLQEHAITFCRHFDTIYHLSDVSVVGGLETTVLCRLRNDDGTFGDDDAFNRFGLTGTVAKWYPKIFNEVSAGFATNRAQMMRNEELQALTFGTNATLPFRTDATTEPKGDAYRTGRIWSNKEWINELYWSDTSEAKPMFVDYDSKTLSMYREKPHGIDTFNVDA